MKQIAFAAAVLTVAGLAFAPSPARTNKPVVSGAQPFATLPLASMPVR
jgi:hypothetical protein